MITLINQHFSSLIKTKTEFLNKNLHIITLDVPYPPDYGGMIDTYYRIKSLHHLGIDIHLHCFEYGRPQSPELESLCKNVSYYTRRPGLMPHFSTVPYIIKSRSSHILLKNLLKDNYPVLFDGLQSTYYLNHPELANRRKFVRVNNIEHRYFATLSSFEKDPLRKMYFYIESLRLKQYEKILKKADKLFTVTLGDFEYFENRYHNAELIPSFHPCCKIESQKGNGEYCLYHGNLSVSENIAVAEFLISKVFPRAVCKCIIAGKNPPKRLIDKSSRFSNIKIISDPDVESMAQLISNAHINILPVFAINGLKLKLLISLCSGRHCIVNERMIRGTWLEQVCHVADSAESMTELINSLMHRPFTDEMISARESLMMKYYNNFISAKKLASVIFPE
jgi:hypothetical protein